MSFVPIEHVYSLTIYNVCQLMADGFMYYFFFFFLPFNTCEYSLERAQWTIVCEWYIAFALGANVGSLTLLLLLLVQTKYGKTDNEK